MCVLTFSSTKWHQPRVSWPAVPAQHPQLSVVSLLVPFSGALPGLPHLPLPVGRLSSGLGESGWFQRCSTPKAARGPFSFCPRQLCKQGIVPAGLPPLQAQHPATRVRWNSEHCNSNSPLCLYFFTAALTLGAGELPAACWCGSVSTTQHNLYREMSQNILLKSDSRSLHHLSLPGSHNIRQ